MPGTRFDAQQLTLPFGPQVAASPTQDGCGPQTFVLVLQTGAVLPQSAFERHATHCEVVPRSLHFGVPPVQAVQLAPQLASVLHMLHVPTPTHVWLLPHPVSVAR